MKHLIAHYKNKFPNCKVIASENSFDVFSNDGSVHIVSLGKNGAGQLLDQSEEKGCSHLHDLSPIPKECRIHKHGKGDKIILDEKHEERQKWVDGNKRSKDGVDFIPSIVELENDVYPLEVAKKVVKKK